MRVSRREILGDVPLVLTAAAFGGRAFAQTTDAEYVEVKTASGRLRGARTWQSRSPLKESPTAAQSPVPTGLKPRPR